MLTTDDPLLLRHDDGRGVTTLTLNRPQAFNSLSEGLLRALQTELDLLAADERLRVLVIA
ncbi:MAG: enoyl-CoA hydratase, partial [Burkholderiales bacterium PBB5]